MIKKDIILKSFSKNLYESESKWLSGWLAEDEVNRDAYIKLKEIYTLESMSSSIIPTEEELSVLRDAKNGVFGHIKRRRRISFAISYAAAIIGISFVSFFGYQYLKQDIVVDKKVEVVEVKRVERMLIQQRAIFISQNEQIALDDNISHTEIGSMRIENNGGNQRIKLSSKSDLEAEVVTESKIIVPRGCRYSVMLPDSSIVCLNAESELTFPSKFEGGERLVKLVGEAYFDVKRDVKNPFIVVFNDSRVEVLGTRFNIRSYKNETWNSVTLNCGSVRVSNRKKSVKINPRERIELTPDSDLRWSVLSDEDYISWIKGHVQYSKSKFEDIMLDLSRRYDVEFDFVTPELRELTLTIRLTKEVKLDELIAAMNSAGESIFNVKYDTKQSKILISK